MKIAISITVAFSLFASCVNAIIIRHDVNDQEYLSLGEKHSPSVAYVGGCASTLIDHNWLLTAAHCVEGKEGALFTARHINNEYRIEKIVVHPKFDRKNDENYDIALVQLKDSIYNGKPARLYEFEEEQGKSVVFIGRGTFGNGHDGLIRDDNKQRGATNTVVSISEQTIGFRFDLPDKATELEGISSRGDSGGPAFISIDSQLYVVGVSSYQVGNGIKEGHYGVMEYYTRVSTAYQWLKSVINNTDVASIPKHPIIDSIKANSREQLIKSIDNAVLTNEIILNEAFYQTVKLNQPELAKVLIRQGARIDKVVIGNTSLYEFAIRSKRKEYFDMLHNEMRDVKNIYKDESPVLPLMVSRFSEDPKLLDKVKRAIEQGANINARTSSGDTAIIMIGWNTNNLELIRYFIELGADLNISNNNGDTPLMDAAYLGKLDILRYLLKSGAKLNLTNKKGRTALDLARIEGNKEAENILLSYANGIINE